MSTVGMFWAGYGCMVIIWAVFQSAVNKAFPENDFMPRNMAEVYGESQPYWGVLAAAPWPATLIYLIFLLLMLPIKGVQWSIEANKRRVAEKNRLKTVPVLKYPEDKR